MRLSQLFKSLLAVGFVLTTLGCASLTPQKIAKKVDAMSDFDLCLASSAEMDKYTFLLDDEIIKAAKERIASKKIYNFKRDELQMHLKKLTALASMMKLLDS